MTFLLLMGLALAGLAAVFAMRSLAFAGLRKRETLAQIEAYGFAAAAPVAAAQRSLKDRLDALAAGLGVPLVRSMRPEKRAEFRRLIRSAGHYRLSLETLAGYRLLATVVLPALWLWFAVSSGSAGFRVGDGLLLIIGSQARLSQAACSEHYL